MMERKPLAWNFPRGRSWPRGRGWPSSASTGPGIGREGPSLPLWSLLAQQALWSRLWAGAASASGDRASASATHERPAHTCHEHAAWPLLMDTWTHRDTHTNTWAHKDTHKNDWTHRDINTNIKTHTHIHLHTIADTQTQRHTGIHTQTIGHTERHVHTDIHSPYTNVVDHSWGTLT